MEPGVSASKLVSSDRPSTMSDIKGPAIDPEAFRVEGHCCGIRLPALKELTGEGLQWEPKPETTAELVAAGVLSAETELGLPKSGPGRPPKLPHLWPGQNPPPDRALMPR
jgi:hypothetical protein